MRRQNNNLAGESPVGAAAVKDLYFDTTNGASTARPVMPLDETPTRAAVRFQRRRRDSAGRNFVQSNKFGRSLTVMALLAVTALGIIAGTLLYRASPERAADENATRTIQPQYQFYIGKTESPGAPKNNAKGAESAFTTKRTGDEESNFSETAAESSDEQEKIHSGVENSSDVTAETSDYAEENKAAPSEEIKKPAPAPARGSDEELNKLLRKNKIGDAKPQSSDKGSAEEKAGNDNGNESESN